MKLANIPFDDRRLAVEVGVVHPDRRLVGDELVGVRVAGSTTTSWV